jgi:hypothetical protein
VLNENIPFFKTALIQEYINTLTCSKLSLCVLRIDPFLTAAQFGGFAPAFEFFNYFVPGPSSR